MTASKSILIISRNQSLLSTRSIILQRAGYMVSAAMHEKEALDFITAPNSFSLVLLCHSIPEANRISMANGIKALNPKLPILMLYNGYDPTSARVDRSLLSLDGPQAMLDIIGLMTLNPGPGDLLQARKSKATTPGV